MTGSASAGGTWGGEGVGNGVGWRGFSAINLGLARGVASEGDDLLEGRAVRPAGRQRQEAEGDPLLRRVGAPLRWIGALRRGELPAGRVERRPQRRGGRRRGGGQLPVDIAV